MAKKVVIVGAGSGYDMVRDYEENKDYEIWVTPSIYPVLASHRIDKIFEIHPLDKWKAGIDYHKLGSKLMLAKPEPSQDVKKATILPLDSLQAKYGMVFSSSVAWMVGYALATEKKEIVLLGVDMDKGYHGQRDGLFFLLGFAKAAKATVVIPKSSKLNVFGKSYGWI